MMKVRLWTGSAHRKLWQSTVSECVWFKVQLDT